jgi:hypothetical protein
MRRRVFWPVLLLPALVACTAILGDFTVGDGGGGDTGTGDVADAASDAPADVAPDVSTLESCSEVANKRRQLTTGASLNAAGVHAFVLPNGNARVVLADYVISDANQTIATVQAYTFDAKNQNSSVDVQTQQTQGSQILALTRYPGQPGGFAALWFQYDQTLQSNFLWASRIQDDQTTWTSPRQLSKVGGSSNVSNAEASFTVLDPQNEKYFVVFSSVSSNVQLILAGATSGSADALATVETFTVQSSGSTAYDLMTPGIAMGGQQPFVLLNTNTNGPPTPGLSEILLVPGQAKVTYTPASTLNYIPLAMNNGPDPNKANVAILEADLTNEVATYRVGKMPFSSMATFDPKTLPASTPPIATDGGFSKLASVTFGNSPHWEVTSSGEQALIASPTVDPLLQKLYGGINFGWWDGQTGALRSYLGGSNHILGDVQNTIDCDVTFVSLTGNLAQIEVAYLAAPNPPQGNNPPPPSDLWVTQIGCQ